MSDTRKGKSAAVAGTGKRSTRKGGKSGKERDESPARKRYAEQKRGWRRRLRNMQRRHDPRAEDYGRERAL